MEPATRLLAPCPRSRLTRREVAKVFRCRGKQAFDSSHVDRDTVLSEEMEDQIHINILGRSCTRPGRSEYLQSTSSSASTIFGPLMQGW